MKRIKLISMLITVVLIAVTGIFYACDKDENSKVNQKTAADTPKVCCIGERTIDGDKGLCCVLNETGYCLPCIVIYPPSAVSFNQIVNYLETCNEQDISDFFSKEENFAKILSVLLLPDHKQYLDKLCSGNYKLNEVLKDTNGITYLEFVNVSYTKDFFRIPVWLLS